MGWVKPLYGKGKIDWAGRFLAGPVSPPIDQEGYVEFSWFADEDEAIRIANNWRAVHSYPLQVIKMVLKRRAQRIYPLAIVGQRLKRLPSIRFKLHLSAEAGNHPNLSQMQDIGGCRAVMQNVEQVRALEARFAEASKKNPKRGPQHFRTTDYLLQPKLSGYRSVHLIYKYQTPSSEHQCYNGQRIEIQLRTQLQHYWATAVETYSTFSGEALKSNVGSAEWMRFFALVSSGFAIQERCPTVPQHTFHIGRACS